MLSRCPDRRSTYLNINTRSNIKTTHPSVVKLKKRKLEYDVKSVLKLYLVFPVILIGKTQTANPGELWRSEAARVLSQQFSSHAPLGRFQLPLVVEFNKTAVYCQVPKF